ncbi:MAG: hypothetical protein GX490_10155 [Bacilli bacterium]|nr:hypothetical protein [Bacilli bacterium]
MYYEEYEVPMFEGERFFFPPFYRPFPRRPFNPFFPFFPFYPFFGFRRPFFPRRRYWY